MVRSDHAAIAAAAAAASAASAAGPAIEAAASTDQAEPGCQTCFVSLAAALVVLLHATPAWNHSPGFGGSMNPQKIPHDSCQWWGCHSQTIEISLDLVLTVLTADTLTVEWMPKLPKRLTEKECCHA